MNLSIERFDADVTIIVDITEWKNSKSKANTALIDVVIIDEDRRVMLFLER